MLVISCIKQLPDTAQVKINPVTITLVRGGIQKVITACPLCLTTLKNDYRQTELSWN